MTHYEIYSARVNEENRREAEELVNLCYKIFGVFTDNFESRITIKANKYNRFHVYFYGTLEELKSLEEAWW